MTEQEYRDEMFNRQLSEQQTITLQISCAQSEIIAQALLEYYGKRQSYPVDALNYYSKQIGALRSQMPNAFPVTYNED